VNEEHRALITALPYDVVVTIAAFSVLLLALVSFVQRLFARNRKAVRVPIVGD